MKYLVFDLEFNQHFPIVKGEKNIASPTCPFEIIQIGAIKLDENLNTISRFDYLIKPEIYPELHPYVKDLTGLTLEELNAAPPFNEVYNNLAKFIASDVFTLCVWGMCDIKELFRNIIYHGLDTSLIPTEYINLQAYISKYLNCPRGTFVGLHRAVELLEIPVSAQFHNALNDAFYTAEIFKKVYDSTIQPKPYDPTNMTIRPKRRKSVIDFDKLLQQFEKMYARKMTEEEQEMIKLAYKMGRTSQFLKDV